MTFLIIDLVISQNKVYSSLCNSTILQVWEFMRVNFASTQVFIKKV